MNKKIVLIVITALALASCGGGNRVDTNSTDTNESLDINLTEDNITIIDDNLSDINTSLDINLTEDNITIIDDNLTDINTSFDINLTEENLTIEDNSTIIYKNSDDISGDIYTGDGTPKEANITKDDFDSANLTLDIKDDFTLTTANNFLFGLNISELDDETIEMLKQFMTLGVSLDYNQSGCVESNITPFSVEDYKNACITGINDDNLDKINLSIEVLNLRDTRDIKVALRVIDELGIRDNDITIVEAKPEPIVDVNQSVVVVTSFEVEDFVNGGFDGIDENNIADMNNFITYQLNLQTLEELKSVVERAYQYNISVDLQCDNSEAEEEHNLTEDGYNLACISTNSIEDITTLAEDLNLSNTKEIRDIYTTAYAIGIELAPASDVIAIDSTIVDTSEHLYIKKTGQTIIFEPKDDGYYQTGVTPQYTRNNNKDVVEDNIRGLMWQDGDEIAIKPWLDDEHYNGCEPMGIVGQVVDGLYITEEMVCGLNYDKGDTAYNYCENLEYSGYDDWRLPYLKELSDLSDYQANGWDENWNQTSYAIDGVFKNISSTAYWSREYYIGFHHNRGWLWGARTGANFHTNLDFKGALRCVREYTESYLATNRDNYERVSDNIIRDNLRGFEWEIDQTNYILDNGKDFDREKSNYGDWEHAVKYCQDKTIDGGGWRLPSINELKTIVSTKRYAPAYKTAFDRKLGVAHYWSSTTANVWEGMVDQAFTVETHEASMIRSPKNVNCKTICIRETRDE